MKQEIMQEKNNQEQISFDDAKVALGLATHLGEQLLPKAPVTQEMPPASPQQQESEIEKPEKAKEPRKRYRHKV